MSAPILVPAQRWALVVGAGDYEHLGQLRYATRDAQAFADGLVQHLDFERDHIRLLTDDAEDPELTPTAGHIRGELGSLLNDPRRSSSDLFVFYFCGHGAGREEGDFLLPTDARKETVTRVGLPVAEVVRDLSGAELRNVLVVVDACREGRENPFGRELFQLADSKRMAVVLGCEPGAQSFEDALLGHGAFTHFLLQSLGSAELVDPVSGALWASRVAKDAQRRVEAWSKGKDLRQQPVVWNDVTRDILLFARPPADFGVDGVARFLGSMQKLEREAKLAALGRYAEALSDAQRPRECIEVLNTAEQLGELSSDLQFVKGLNNLALGRSIEAARALDAVRRADPQSRLAQAATLFDLSGAVTSLERAAAAEAMWKAGTIHEPVLLIRMVEAALSGGAGVAGLAMTEEALARAGAEDKTRETAFLRGAQAAFRGKDDEALECLATAQRLSGSFPTEDMLLQERLNLLNRTRGAAAAIELLDSWIATHPDAGRWCAIRAYLRSLPAQTAAELEQVIEDARRALRSPLGPDTLLLLTIAAGPRADELAEPIAAQAAAHPQAWQAQVAALSVSEREDVDVAMGEIANLTPRPAQIYVAYASIVFNKLQGMLQLNLEAVAEDAAAQEPYPVDAVAVMDTIVKTLAPLASLFGEDVQAWTLLATILGQHEQHEACFRLFERHLGSSADAGRLPPEIVICYARACLDTGRLDRFRTLQRAQSPGSRVADQLAWLAAAYLASAGDDAGARAELGERVAPLDPEMAPFAAALRALLAARAGERALAGSLLSAEDPQEPLALALTGLAARAMGDEARTRRIDRALDLSHATTGCFAFVGFWKGAAQSEPFRLAALAAFWQPGNPLLREASFAVEPGAASFERTWDFSVAESQGPLAAVGAGLTLAVLPGGRVVGALVAPEDAAVPDSPEDKLVLEGHVDSFGNLEANFQFAGGTYTLLGKLAPPAAYAEVEVLRSVGQLLLLLDPDGIPYTWSVRPNQ